MSNNLETAFSHTAHGRKALNDIIKEPPGFHNSTWQDAFTQTFDQIDMLEQATPHDAATLGILFINVISGLISQLIEESDNRIETLSRMMGYADHGLNEARRFFEYALLDLAEQAATYTPVYIVEIDSSIIPHAFVLETPDAREPKRHGHYYNVHELHKALREHYGPNIKQLKRADFQTELEKRLTHTSSMLLLLQQHGALLGQDLSRSFVYGSSHRPMNSSWRVHEAAVYIQTDKQATGYYTYIAVPTRLDAERIDLDELTFVSHP